MGWTHCAWVKYNGYNSVTGWIKIQICCFNDELKLSLSLYMCVKNICISLHSTKDLYVEREKKTLYIMYSSRKLLRIPTKLISLLQQKRRISLRSGDRKTWGGMKKRLLTGCGCHGYWCGVEWMTMAGLHFLCKNGELKRRDRLPTKDAGVMMAKRWRMLLLRWWRARLLWIEEGRSSGLMSLSPASSLTQACFCRRGGKDEASGGGR